jgi:hypothetical protein
MPKIRTLVYLWLAFVTAAVVMVLFVPPEQSLGNVIRLIYFHGAWVWTGIALFSAAGLTGLAAIFTHRITLSGWSSALGRAALCYWLTYLPMSLLLMQLSWNGFFFDEPRWRIPFGFAVVGSLLQVGLYLVNKPFLTAIANALFAVTLLTGLSTLTSVLHPESPISQSGSSLIRILFYLTLLFAAASGFVLTLIWRRLAIRSTSEVLP